MMITVTITNNSTYPEQKHDQIKRIRRTTIFHKSNKASLKETHTRKINEEDNNETMYTSFNKDKDKYEGRTLESKPSTPYLPNTGQVMNSDD